MKRFHKIMAGVSSKGFVMLGAALVFLGGMATNLCMFPFWHNEPELPESMRDKTK